MMAGSFKFIIRKGKTNKYNALVKAECAPGKLPTNTSAFRGEEVLETDNKSVYDKLVDYGFVTPFDKYRKSVTTNENIGKSQTIIVEKGKFDYNSFADWLYYESDHYFVHIQQNDELYYYINGAYVEGGDSFIGKIIQTKMGGNVIVTNASVAEVIGTMKRFVLKDIDIMQSRSERVACNNGVINLRTKELEPHSPENYIFKKIPVDYVPGATCDNFNELVDKLLPDNELDKYKLNIMLGYPLINSYIYNRIFFLQGESGTGKSTIINIIQNMYGSDNIANIRLHDLIKRDFMRVGLINTYANFSGDASDESIHDASMLKTLSGESRISIDVKNVKKPVKLINCSKLIIDTNNMPEFNLRDNAIFRRIVKITFDRIITEDEKTSNFMDKYLLKSEMEGLLVRAVNSAHDILVTDNPFKSTSIEESKEEYENARFNIIDDFIGRHIQKYPDHAEEEFEVQSDVWLAFKKFAAMIDIKPAQVPGVSTFYKSFPLKCEIDKPSQKWVPKLKKSPNCYHGIRLIHMEIN